MSGELTGVFWMEYRTKKSRFGRSQTSRMQQGILDGDLDSARSKLEENIRTLYGDIDIIASGVINPRNKNGELTGVVTVTYKPTSRARETSRKVAGILKDDMRDATERLNAEIKKDHPNAVILDGIGQWPGE